ncbi:hypothetical protein [Pseudarthrobacter sp. 1C304]|uniref:hypothetical protein n=1 Tax=Pseudarthrobacter sp. 1C304 TaxID=3457438 RepID=UPI003FD26B3F
MALEVLGTVFACLAVIVGFTLAGMSTLRRGGNAKGATGTLGSVLGMMDPATGAPTRQEAAAAREELKQQRHESSQSGTGPNHGDPYSGRITLPARTAAEHQAEGPDTI